MAHTDTSQLRDTILEYSRQSQIGAISPFLSDLLDEAIAGGYYASESQLEAVNLEIIRQTRLYAEQSGRTAVVLG